MLEVPRWKERKERGDIVGWMNVFEIGQPEVASSVGFNVLVCSHDEVLLLVLSKSASGGGKDNKKFIPIYIFHWTEVYYVFQ